MANIGHPQSRNGKYIEHALVTSGNDLIGIDRFLSPGASTYTAADVVMKLMSALGSPAGSKGDPRRPAVDSVRSLL